MKLTMKLTMKRSNDVIPRQQTPPHANLLIQDTLARRSRSSPNPPTQTENERAEKGDDITVGRICQIKQKKRKKNTKLYQ